MRAMATTGKVADLEPPPAPISTSLKTHAWLDNSSTYVPLHQHHCTAIFCPDDKVRDWPIILNCAQYYAHVKDLYLKYLTVLLQFR